MVSPMNQGLGSNMYDGQQIARITFLTALDQHRKQVDQILQEHNEQVHLELQQQTLSQNKILLNLAESMARDVLAKKNEEVSHLRMHLQSTQEFLQTVLQQRDELQYFAEGFYEMNKWLISQLPPMQSANVHGHGLSPELESTGSCCQAPKMEGASVGRAHTSLLCKICGAHDACMLILPCKHLCVCKSCGINLTVCPICFSMKNNMIEAQFG